MNIALASPSIASSLDDGLDKIERLMGEASARGAEIVCFPEAYLPGLRGQDFEVLPWDHAQQEQALKTVARSAREYSLATILGMERITESGRQIVAVVIDGNGEIQGYQTKNQLDPTEDQPTLVTNGHAKLKSIDLRFQESATSLIAPSGQCQAYLRYGQEGVLVQSIDVEAATGLLATRYSPERYQELV